jgi:hypothetical protein
MRHGARHEDLRDSGDPELSGATLEESMRKTGVKFLSAFTRLGYFKIYRDIILDGMHDIMNIVNRVAASLLGVDFTDAVRQQAKEDGVHPTWHATAKVKNSKGRQVFKVLHVHRVVLAC